MSIRGAEGPPFSCLDAHLARRQDIEAQEGDTVAAALLRARHHFTRSIKYHAPGPVCLAGSAPCLCAWTSPSLPACRVKAQEGMACERQNGRSGGEGPGSRRGLLFPDGLDHHHLLTGRGSWARRLEVARRLAGLGGCPLGSRSCAGELRMVELAIVGVARRSRRCACRREAAS